MLPESSLTESPIIAVDSLARERSIPIRSADLTRRFRSDPAFSTTEREDLDSFGRLLRAIYHEQFHDWLLQLKDFYAPLDPDTDCVELTHGSRVHSEDLDESFLGPFEAALIRANY
ncbi:MAG TPA: hypothetical protein VFT74_18100, partial [Isosphaeraceae bacterium]|nr:hypothetical protein [Isosphaeraceae bacterium]